MFTMLPQQRKDNLKESVHLHYRQTMPTTSDNISKTIHVPCVICFAGKDQLAWQHEMFKFELSLTDTIFIMSNLRQCNTTMPEEILYFLLEWIIIEAQQWARTAAKKRIVIETALLHCTEHFAVHGYLIKPFYGFSGMIADGLKREYRGSKNI